LHKFFFKVSARNKEYQIVYNGLKDGDHSFHWKLSRNFLELFDKKDITGLDIIADVLLKKSSRILQFTVNIKGIMSFECDRCLDNVDIPVDSEHTLVFKIEGNQNDFEDEILFLSEDETQLDISPFLYESLVFSVPPRRVHGEDKNGKSLCNPEMTAKLNELLIKEEKPAADPRWNELGKLLNN
jgi:uncharacterized protein